MRVDADKCISCGVCPPYCPMGAIGTMEDGLAFIDQDECVECGVCRRSRVCPTSAFYQPPLSWPREVRAIFSDQTYRPAGAPRRTSEGMKIGDVIGQYRRGEVHFLVELGRPGIGARFHHLEALTSAMAALGFRPRHGRALARVMDDIATGRVKDEVRNEKASRISIHYPVPAEQAGAFWVALQKAAGTVDNVMSVGLVRRCEADGTAPVHGLPVYPNGKTNVGLGRPRAEEK